jgi:FKBP-type peptidyl-prolyl cis-trans isomerase
MNFKQALLGGAFLLAGTQFANAQNFEKYPSGLEQHIVTKGTGTYLGKAGDIATMNLTFKIGDSTIIDSKVMNNGMPFEQPLNNPAVEGDVFEGILKMKKGEVSDFRIPASLFFERNKQPMPEWVKPTEYVSWHVEMVNLKNQEEAKKEAESKGAGQKAEDEKLILAHLKSIGVSVKELPKTGKVTANPKVAYKDASGLYYVVTKVGTGPLAVKNQKASVNYTGSLLDGTLFDSNVDPKFNHVEPIEIGVDAGQVIKGWDIMLTKMNVGEKVDVYIPSGLAYGPTARPPHIPANGILKFEMELLKAQ